MPNDHVYMVGAFIVATFGSVLTALLAMIKSLFTASAKAEDESNVPATTKELYEAVKSLGGGK